MNAALNGLGSQLFGWFGQLSIELGVLALVVLAAGRLLPIKSPALRHLLWVVVLLKPLVAVAVSSPFTLFTPFAPLVPLAESGRDVLAFLPVEHPTVHAAASPIVATSSVRLTAAGWGAILWMAGAALLIGRILIGHGILWRLRRQAQVQCDGPLFDALRQARLAFDCYPRVEVATSPSISSPMALGILRPIIVFPADLVDKLRADELSLILMHELAHVRRCDNLVLLLHRLVAAVLFFHPAVWLCGRMLRREAEQGCDDLVVCATGREKAYARGLAHVAECSARFNPLVRRIPTMNAIAAVESDLALRIRRTLGGGARRMGARARVFAAVLLCPLAVVTLPSCGTTGKRTGGDMAAEKVLEKESRDDGIWREAMATDPDEWSVELKAQLLALKPGSTIEEIAEEVRQDMLWREAMATDPDEWPDELKAQFLALKAPEKEILFIVVDQDGYMTLNEDKPVTFATLKEELQAQRQLLDNTTTIIIQGDERTQHRQIVQIMDIARQVGLVDQVIATEPQTEVSVAAKQSRDNRTHQEELKTLLMTLGQAEVTDPDGWSEELKAQLLALNPDSTIEEIAEEVPQRSLWRQEIAEEDRQGRLRGEAMAMATYLAQGPPLALKSDTTIEEIAEAVRKRQEGGIPASAEALIRTAVVVERAMATPAEEWTEDMNADIERAGWDLDEFSEEIRSRRVWQEAMATDPDEWSEELKARILALTAPEKANLFIVLDQDGNMKLNGDESVTFATLKEELQAKRQLHDNTTMIIIQGDEDAARAQIVQVMEIARQVGLVDQVIATEPQRATE